MKAFDMHDDMGTNLYHRFLNGEKDVFKKYHLDDFKKGEVEGVFCACFFRGDESYADMQKMILHANEVLDTEETTVKVTKKEDLDIPNKIHAVISVEGMCGIGENVEEEIDWLYEHNVKVASLVWNESNQLADGWPNNPLRGLSDKGIKAVEKLNEHNIIIDVSHINEAGFWDIVRLRHVFIYDSPCLYRFLAIVFCFLSSPAYIFFMARSHSSGFTTSEPSDRTTFDSGVIFLNAALSVGLLIIAEPPALVEATSNLASSTACFISFSRNRCHSTIIAYLFVFLLNQLPPFLYFFKFPTALLCIGIMHIIFRAFIDTPIFQNPPAKYFIPVYAVYAAFIIITLYNIIHDFATLERYIFIICRPTTEYILGLTKSRIYIAIIRWC